MARRRTELAARRRSCGLTQETLAESLGIERTTVARWELGDTTPLPWVRPGLAQHLHVTPDALDELLEPASPGTEHLSTTQAPSVARRQGRIGPADLAAMNLMAEAFTQADHQLGGGHAASTVDHYLQSAVLPLLADGHDDPTMRSLVGVAGRLCDLAAFMYFDSEQHDAAQLWFGRALRLASSADDAMLTAHVLGDMTMQAIHTGAVGQAVALTDGLTAKADRTGSARVVARAYALAARAHAAAGDTASADIAAATAERALERTPCDDDPPWIRFFTTAQLQTELLYVACALGRTSDVERLADDVLVLDATMQRRHVLSGAAIATAFVGGRSRTSRDPERAVGILTSLLPAAAGLSSARSVSSIRAARRRLSSYAGVPGIDTVDEHLRQLTATA